MKPSLDELVAFAESQIGKEGTEREAVLRASIASTLRWLRENEDLIKSAIKIRMYSPTAFEALRAFPEAEISERTTQ